MSKHTDKVALITGGSTGIGLATAKRLVSEGAFVFLTGRRKPELDAAVKQIGHDVIGIQADSANLEDLDRVMAQIREQKGRLDIVFANAGTGSFAPLEAITEEHYHGIFDVNVKGLLFTVQKTLPLLRDGSSVILNASIVASTGTPAFSVYSASKAAVRSFARSWANDLKARHIRVNAVSPGPIDTPGLAGLAPTPDASKAMLDQMKARVPLGRLGEADEIAKAVSFLASDDASFITGTELFVDGGTNQV